MGFSRTLARNGLTLTREKTQILQVNVGLLCNQTCGHCHLNAGPGKTEVMTRTTADQVAAWAGRVSLETIDITGGAPEMNPDIVYMVRTYAALAPKLIFRSNLSALNSGGREPLMGLLKSLGVVIVASFPSINEAQADAQRGDGIFTASIAGLKTLNAMGYGHPDTGLELNLVSNPTGAFTAPNQAQTEKRFRQMLERKWGIVFNHLFSFSNAPLGRFRRWLERSGNLAAYLKKLSDGFNPCAVDSVMCRTLVSVSWDGYLYDCDFNLARGLPMGRSRIHVSDMNGLPVPGQPIATADHCYTCTAGAGFT
ncbi:MAG: arsenosugar biosynthesis radical SAM protein ArsS [Desulfosarcina sp.]|nr:arsenosugar biosynthesis radical SAM protein ArsS [Desulfosarcina sp.]MBC2743010.1 arsenosugar biosynthesis radical SAM protein ArsS [Desulfosarcina sp.]MBC2765920.1 radical SAM/Cys-rich domain protein [Desulfosarcina sp.]